MSLVDELDQLWYEATHATTIYSRMKQPLTSGRWFNAQNIKNKLRAELQNIVAPTPTPTPDPTPTTPQIDWGARADGEPYGISDPPWNWTAVDTFESHAGKRMTLLHYGLKQPWLQTFDINSVKTVLAKGKIPVISIGDSDSHQTFLDIINGLHDAQIAAMADALKALGKEVWLRPWWEPNQYTSHWFPFAVPYYVDPPTYVKAWQHYKQIFIDRGASNVKFYWCVNYIRTDTTRVQLIKDLYPGDAFVDKTGFDGYNSSAPSANFATLYKLTYDTIAARAPGKDMVIGEISSRDTTVFAAGVKGAWIKASLADLPNYPLIKAMIWFNWDITENNEVKDWQIESSLDSQGAFWQAIRNDYFKGALI